MNAPPRECPHPDLLRAFGLGEQLDPASDQSVSEHLQHCEKCSAAVAAVSDDGFLARRRAAEKSHGTPAPDGPLDGLARSLTRASDLPKSAPPPAESIPPELASHPEYEIIRELGRGGMGVVYLVKNKLMDRLEALKVMATGVAVRSGASDRFLQEIRSAAQLTHQYVVQAHSARQVGDLLMLSMEYVPDGDLGSLVKEKGPLPVVNACYYTWQVALALQHAHEKGMVHRDIKPSNLILMRNGKRHTVKVTDFGLAKARKDSDASGLTSAGQMMGTPHYMSPEQALDAANVDIRADIYSLGCTFYFLLTGQTPFSGGPMEVLWRHRMEEPRPVTELRPDVPAEVATIVARMMAKDPAERFQTPAEVAKALSPLLKKAPKPEQQEVLVETAGPETTEAGTSIPLPLPQDREDRWGELSFSDPSSGPTEAQSPSPEPRRRPLWLWPAIVAGGLLLGLLAAWGTGALRVKTKEGVIVLEGLPADAEVLVDGETVTVSRNGEEATVTLTREGPDHRLRVMLGDKEIVSKDVTVTLGGDPVRVRIEPVVIPTIGMPEQEPKSADGFVPLFNGKDLSGWKTERGFPGQWQVENAVLTGTSPNPDGRGYLLSSREYSDFILRFEFQFDAGSTAAVAIRATEGEMMPNLQGELNMRDHPLLALADDRPEPDYSAGSGVWLRDGRRDKLRDIGPSTPPKTEFRPATWYPVEIIVHGDRCTARSGDVTFADMALDPNRSSHRGIIPGLKRARGGVGFIAQVGTVRYRNIEICELGPDGKPLVAIPPPGENGFVPLFNKRDLAGWDQQDPSSVVWSVHNGLLLMRAVGFDEPRELPTMRKDYGNFHLRMRVKHEDGICFLNVRQSEPAYRILIGSTNDNLLPKTGRGSIDRSPSLGPPKKADFEKVAGPARIKPGVWFNLEVIAENDRIRTLINGRQATELKDARGALPPGRIALGGGPKARMQIESIEIKELEPRLEVKAGPPARLVGTGNWRKLSEEELACGVKSKEIGAILFGDAKWTDYDFTADVNFSLGNPPCTIVCRSEDERHLYGFVLGPSTSKGYIIRRLGEKDGDQIAEGTARLPTGKWLAVKVSVRGKRLDASVREAGSESTIAALSHDNVLFDSGGVGFAVGAPVHQAPGAIRLRNIKVTKPDGTVLWEGLPELPK